MRIRLSYCHSVVPSFCRSVMPSSCRGVVLSSCRPAVLSCCHDAVCRFVKRPCYRSIVLSFCRSCRTLVHSYTRRESCCHDVVLSFCRSLSPHFPTYTPLPTPFPNGTFFTASPESVKTLIGPLLVNSRQCRGPVNFHEETFFDTG